jgi:hypothetical protein
MARMRTHTKRPRRNRPGMQHMWGFDNGHLASVVPDPSAANRWELTVRDGYARPRYSMLSSGDVIGALRPTDVRRILREIEALG